MAVNSVTMQTAAVYETAQSAKGSKKEKSVQEKTSVSNTAQDEYVKSEKSPTDSTKQIYTKDSATVERLKQDAELRKQRLIELVQKSLGKQAGTFQTLSDMFQAIKDGKVNVDPNAVEQAKKDVAEDGYWGVKQTSDRLVEMAKALSGGDTSKADEMIAAIEKGFNQATKSWGGELPDICKDTLAAAKEKLTQWKESTAKSTE